MLSRRTLIGKVAVGAAAALAVGAARTGAAATTRPRRAATDDPGASTEAAAGEGLAPQALEPHAAAPDADPTASAAPAPWALVAPYGAGAVVAHDWTLADLTPVQDGSAVVTLRNARGHAQRIHLCRNDGSPQGLVHTRRIDLVVMNQGYGELPTEEAFGQAVAALAHAVAANEATVAADVVAGLLPHAARVARFAAVDGPSADGKLR